MGIEWDKGNAFWVYDGHNGHICWYDFQLDHGPGNSNHDDGLVHRYREVPLKRLDGVSSHLVLDHESGWLYIVDSGNGRILKMNTKTGSKLKDVSLFNEVLEEHWEMSGVDWKIFTDKDLQKACWHRIKQ